MADENGSTPDIFEPTIVPMGALPGKFTVNAEGKQVYFSKGNLWYGKVEGIEEKTFNFEANQWGFSSKWNENHVSHFYWNKVAVIAYSKKLIWVIVQGVTYSCQRRHERRKELSDSNHQFGCEWRRIWCDIIP